MPVFYKHLNNNILMQEYLSNILQFAGMGIWQYDLDGGNLYWSAECSVLFGLNDHERWLNFETFLDFVHPDDRNYVFEVSKPVVFERKNILIHFEHRIVRKDGVVRWIREQARPFARYGSEERIILGMAMDITEEVEEKNKLICLQENLEQTVAQRTAALKTINKVLQNEICERKTLENTLLYQLELEKMVSELATHILELLPDQVDRAINDLLTQAGKFNQVDRSYLFLLSEDRKFISNTHEWCSAGISPQLEMLQNIPVDKVGWWMDNLQGKQLVSIPRVDEMPEEAITEQDIFKTQKIKSLLAVPVTTGDRLIGFIGFDSVKTFKTWTNEEIALLKILAVITSNAIINSRYEQSLAAEKELLSVTLHNISEGLIVVDPRLCIIMLNNHAAELTGWNRLKAVGKELRQVMPLLDPRGANRVEDLLSLLLEDNMIDSLNLPLVMVNKNNQRVYLEVKTSPIRSGSSQVNGYVIVFRDITKRLQLEAQQALDKKLQLIGQMTAGIAHEINTPLQYIGDNIYYFAEAFERISRLNSLHEGILSDPGLSGHPLVAELSSFLADQEIRRYLQELPEAVSQASEGIERVTRLIRALRGMAHSGEAGKEPADINRAIVNCLVVSRSEWKNSADFILNLDPDLPQVECAIDLLHQVFLGMIVNAVYAVKEAIAAGKYKRGKIDLNTNASNGRVNIEITDNGVGLPDQLMDRIFDPFFTTKKADQGTGQGLAIARDIIVNRHHGSIDVCTSTEGGLSFLISLPY